MIQYSDPGGLLQRADPNTLMALRGLASSSNQMGLWKAIVDHLSQQGWNNDDIHTFLNMGQGPAGQQAMAGDWMQQVKAHYGPNASWSNIFNNTPYAQYFQQPNQPNFTNTVQNAVNNNGVNTKSAQPTPTGSVDTSSILPTNGVWDVNTFYPEQGTVGQPQGQVTGTGSVWNPTTPFTTSAANNPAAPQTNSLADQLNSRTMRTGATDFIPGMRGRNTTAVGPAYQGAPSETGHQVFTPPAPTPTTSPTTNGRRGYAFVSKGWNGSNFKWGT